MKKKRTVVLSILAAVVLLPVLAMVWHLWFRMPERVASDDASVSSGATAVKRTSRCEARPKKRPSVRNVRTKPTLALDDEADEDSNRTPEEKRLAAAIEKALDDEDFELAKQCAAQALMCKDKDIRQAMVDTLDWFGEKAIPELTPFIVDPDEDIAEDAMNAWDTAVSSIDDDGEKIGMVEMAMQVISNEDALESISNTYIGIDEKLAVESLLRVIESGGSAKGIEKAKETYEFVTGDEFVDRATAEKWIAEEYDPPENG